MIDRIIYNIAGRVAAVAMLLFAAVGCQQRYELDLPLATNADEILVTKDAGHSYIMVYSTGNWTIALEKQVSWVALSKSEGSGNEFVQIDYQANTDLSRGVNIIITSRDLRRTVYFAQEAGMADSDTPFLENPIPIPCVPPEGGGAALSKTETAACHGESGHVTIPLLTETLHGFRDRDTHDCAEVVPKREGGRGSSLASPPGGGGGKNFFSDASPCVHACACFLNPWDV